MVRLMVGRDLDRMALSPPRHGGKTRLRVERLTTYRYPNRDVSFEVAEGEVFCLAGLVGAGRSELGQTIFGTDPAMGGTVEVDGASVSLGDPKASISSGIALVPEDRRGLGLLVEWSILDNITLPTLPEYATAGLVRRADETTAASREADALHVKAPSVQIPAANLSGGNQQKVVVAKWLLGGPKVLILDEPTRGVDVGAKAEIYEIMRSLTNQGLAVLMVSSDMEEVLAVSDRVGVMHEGRLTGILPREECTEEAIMKLAVGGAA
jgi:ribose transport system ATP-binding protein